VVTTLSTLKTPAALKTPQLGIPLNTKSKVIKVTIKGTRTLFAPAAFPSKIAAPSKRWAGQKGEKGAKVSGSGQFLVLVIEKRAAPQLPERRSS
jgi:hypothetical protein